MLSSVLIAASLAVVPSATAESQFRYKIPPPGNGPPNNGYVTTKKTQRSGASCYAFSGTTNFKLSKDAHVKAVAEAWKYACSSDPKDPYWWGQIYNKIKDVQKDYDYGIAYAKAIAVASASCNAYGNAYGCAASYANAKAWATSVSSAHASAWAEAVNECYCDGKLQTNVAQSDTNADEFKYLVAKVEAVASADVCVDSREKGYDEAYDFAVQTCVQDIYTTVFAKAVAKACIAGGCISKDYYKTELEYGAYTAEAYTSAVAEIDVVETKGCVPYFDKYNPYK